MDSQKVGEQCIITDDESTLFIIKTNSDNLPNTLDTITNYLINPSFNSSTTTNTSTNMIKINSIPYLTKQYLLKKISNSKSEYHQFVDYQSDRDILD